MDNSLKPDWSQLAKGHCPKCEDYMHGEDNMVCCDSCDFRIGKEKYLDLIKGRESNAYKRRVRSKVRTARQIRKSVEFQKGKIEELRRPARISVDLT